MASGVSIRSAPRRTTTGISSGRLMLGGTIVGDRLRDLLSLAQWLRTLDEVFSF